MLEVIKRAGEVGRVVRLPNVKFIYAVTPLSSIGDIRHSRNFSVADLRSSWNNIWIALAPSSVILKPSSTRLSLKCDQFRDSEKIVLSWRESMANLAYNAGWPDLMAPAAVIRTRGVGRERGWSAYIKSVRCVKLVG